MKQTITPFRIMLAIAMLSIVFMACKKDVSVADVRLSQTSVILNPNDTLTLFATVLPDNATNSAVVWNSSNPAVATVSDGKITAIAMGTTTISVTTLSGNKTATCEVAVAGITFNQATTSLYVGNTLNLSPTVFPANAPISWSSSDTIVATVRNGVVTGKWLGETTISATIRDSMTATIKITVDFQDGTERPMFTIDDVQYAYPAPDQQYFLKGEHPTGFIKLARNFDYVFTNSNMTFRARLLVDEVVEATVPITWNASTTTMSWTLPNLENSTLYTFELISVSNGNEMIIWSYDFRTSMFSTFAEKMEKVVITNTYRNSLLISGLVRFLWGNMVSSEGFDQSDIIGVKYTQNKPLIVVKSALTDNYHRNIIAPMLYEKYPFGGAVKYSREEGQSIIPDWAIVKSDNYDYNTTAVFPWVHFLAPTYFEDFNDAKRQLATNPTAQATYGHLFPIDFPILPNGDNYTLNFSYTLPNGVVTDSSVVKTFVLP